MELSIINRLRIAAVMALGILVLGFFAWPLVSPADPLAAVTLYDSGIDVVAMALIVVLSFLVGAAAFFISYPLGYEIAPIAVPAGLAAVACRGGDMTSLIRLNNTLAGRQALYSSLRWEGIFWVLVVAAGFAGVYAAMKFSKGKPGSEYSLDNDKKLLNIAASIIAASVTAILVIALLARDVKMFDSKLSSVTGQPGAGQIGFAIFAAFALGAFIAKKFFNVDYRYPAAASVPVLVFALTAYTRQDVLGHMIEHWPAAFYTYAICAILPVQMVSFAFLGAISGYWMSIKFDYWQKHSQ
jgi:hypothetical protein